MKVGASLKKQCTGCQIIIRSNKSKTAKRRYVRCKTDRRHNRREG